MMTKPLALVYTDDYLRYDFGPEHPLRPLRVRLFYELMKSYDLIDGMRIKEYTPPPVDKFGKHDKELQEIIQFIHDPEYVHYVRMVSDSGGVDGFNEGHLYGLGSGDNPLFSGMYEAAAIHVAGTVYSCDLVMNGEADRAFSLGGGFHHAMQRKASGFCIFNDVAIGIKYLLERYKLKRILYLDIDAHHGDGVQWAFYSDPRVLTISIHEGPATLFPGTGETDESGEGYGRGYSINLPLPPGTSDEAYIYGFRELVLPAASAFKPDVIVAQLGVDAHFSDPLTHIRLTTGAYREIGIELDALLKRIGNTKLIGVTGGGYDVVNAPRAWLVLLSGLMAFQIDDRIPESWIELCKREAGEEPSRTLHDEKQPQAMESQRDRIMAIVKEKVAAAKRETFPAIGAGIT